MKQFTMNLSEAEIAYIRMALCARNLKMCNKMFECMNASDTEGVQLAKDARAIGHKLVRNIDHLIYED